MSIYECLIGTCSPKVWRGVVSTTKGMKHHMNEVDFLPNKEQVDTPLEKVT